MRTFILCFTIAMAISLVGCPENKLRDKVEITDLCSDQFVQDYNSIIDAANGVKNSTGTKRKLLEDNLSANCDKFFDKYSLRLECIAQRGRRDIVVRAGEHETLCEDVDQLNNSTIVPQKIK